MTDTQRLAPTSHEWAKEERLIVFDGVCNWCNAWVDFTITHDPHAKFKFGTLQSEPAQQILTSLRLSTEGFETFLLLEQGRVYTKSTAALKIMRQLSGLWSLLYIGIVIPRPFRDAIYDYVARRRYRWMGKPTPVVFRPQPNATGSCEELDPVSSSNGRIPAESDG